MNGIVLVDKPEGWTSHDVVAKLRGVLHERRAGHSGTLDPMATGLLVVFFGRATRAVEFAEAHEKEYIAGLKLGLVTDTQDTTGTVLSKRTTSVSKEMLETVLSDFRGDIMQTPPMYSAIKVGGRRLYDIARKGGTADVTSRPVTISGLDIVSGEGDSWTLKVVCSKGTYIRTLCSDIGDALSCGGCMSSLRRTRAGMFHVENAHTLEEIITAADVGEAARLILPTEELFRSLPETRIDAAMEKKCRNGNSFSAALPDGDYRVFSSGGDFLMLGRCVDGTMNTVKSFFEV